MFEEVGEGGRNYEWELQISMIKSHRKVMCILEREGAR